jgi:hypothetical protein
MHKKPIGIVLISHLLICLVFLGCVILFSCSPKQQSNSTLPSQEMDGALSTVESMPLYPLVEPMPPQETNGVPFINEGVLNITNNLNIRDTPSTKGNILRQSSFGEYFNIYEKRGSGNIENGVLDLWYRVSLDGEWVNALYLRTFPFYIASDKTYPDNTGGDYGFNLNTVVIKIEGYREIDRKKQLKVNITAHNMWPYNGVLLVTTGNSDQVIELLEEYLIDPSERNIVTEDEIQQNSRNYDHIAWNDINSGDYNVKLIDNNFDNLRKYSLELEEIVKNYKRRFSYPYDFTEVEENVKIFSFDDDTNDVTYEIIFNDFDNSWTTIIKINRLSNIALNGVKIRNKKDDIILQFGNNFRSEEYSYNETFVEHIIYDLCKSDYAYKIEFILNGGTVQQILYSQIRRGK